MRRRFVVVACALLLGGPTSAGPPASVVILVAKRDLRQGEKVQSEDLEEREVPGEWATASQVGPENARYVVGQALRLPVLAGAPLLWSFFGDSTFGRRCHEVMRVEPSAPAQVARHRQAALGR